MKTRDFKAFILRGNVVDLAVGIVIGVAQGSPGRPNEEEVPRMPERDPA